ncbi:MULE domain-containing protein [Trichonephila clavipes]|nr:MULE domain-containing protein [Trichonephila clavipes]
MGGLWESGIKSVKYHLKRALGRSRLTYEEFETVIIQVEGILNSRPLTPISIDFDNFEIKPLAENNKGNSGSLEKMEYRLSECSPTERKVDDREGQSNVWYNGNCKGGFYTSLQLAFRGASLRSVMVLMVKSTEEVFRIYFSAIKNGVGKIETTTFMTDDAPPFYNAWSYVMGTVKNALLCAWHVTRNCYQNLNKIKNPEKRKIVNKALKAVKDELCFETFTNIMKQFMEDLLNDPDTSEFGKYLQQNYAQRPEKWAYCYRKGLGINGNMYLESNVAIDGLLKLGCEVVPSLCLLTSTEVQLRCVRCSVGRRCGFGGKNQWGGGYDFSSYIAIGSLERLNCSASPSVPLLHPPENSPFFINLSSITQTSGQPIESLLTYSHQPITVHYIAGPPITMPLQTILRKFAIPFRTLQDSRFGRCGDMTSNANWSNRTYSSEPPPTITTGLGASPSQTKIGDEHIAEFSDVFREAINARNIYAAWARKLTNAKPSDPDVQLYHQEVKKAGEIVESLLVKLNVPLFKIPATEKELDKIVFRVKNKAVEPLPPKNQEAKKTGSGSSSSLHLSPQGKKGGETKSRC